MIEAQALANENWEEKTSGFISADVVNHHYHLSAYQTEIMLLWVMINWWSLHRAGAAQEPQDCREALPEPAWSEIAAPVFPHCWICSVINSKQDAASWPRANLPFLLQSPQFLTLMHLIAKLQGTGDMKMASPSSLK